MNKLATAGTSCEYNPALWGVPAQPSTAARPEPHTEASQKAWLAVQTRYRFEKKVAAQLSARGLEVFLPLRKETRAWGDRNKVVIVPLFPGYAFLHAAKSLALKLLLLQTPGVMGFVSLAGTAATVPSKQMEDLRLLLDHDVPLYSCPLVELGQSARICRGRLKGVEGLVTGTQDRLLIPLACMRCSLAADVKRSELELL